MKTITLKVIASQESSNKTINAVLNDFKSVLENGVQYSIEFDPMYVGTEDLKAVFNEDYEDAISIRDGVSGGCYGARDGKSYPGFTLYLDSSLFETRFIDSDFDEVINIEQLCNEYGTLLEIDAENHRDSMESMGIEGKSDNTYNYLGHNSCDPVPMCHANFELFQTEDESEPVTIIVKFHCGGDVRGNYTSEVVYKFDDIYEAYNAFNPGLHLIDEDNLDEINRLKDLIWQDPADKELLKKELRELIGA